jgi:hypothetical protein
MKLFSLAILLSITPALTNMDFCCIWDDSGNSCSTGKHGSLLSSYFPWAENSNFEVAQWNRGWIAVAQLSQIIQMIAPGFASIHPF